MCVCVCVNMCACVCVCVRVRVFVSQQGPVFWIAASAQRGALLGGEHTGSKERGGRACGCEQTGWRKAESSSLVMS